MELSEQESQLIEILREQSGEDLLRLNLSYLDGLWNIKMSANDGKPPAEATAPTFDDAWDRLGLTG